MAGPIGTGKTHVAIALGGVLHEVVHGCLQLHGGSGFMRGTPIERMARENRLYSAGRIWGELNGLHHDYRWAAA